MLSSPIGCGNFQNQPKVKDGTNISNGDWRNYITTAWKSLHEAIMTCLGQRLSHGSFTNLITLRQFTFRNNLSRFEHTSKYFGMQALVSQISKRIF
jgi:predicted N-formylglutamate amidohydrolase